LTFACQSPVRDAKGDESETISEKAERLSKEFMLIDTHIDVPYRLVEEWEDISTRTEKGHFDYERARKGGLDVPFMSIYVGASYQESGGAKEKADELIDLVHGFAIKWPDKFAMAYSVSDVEDKFSKGLISLPMGMENGAPIGDDIQNLRWEMNRLGMLVDISHVSDSAFYQIIEITEAPLVATHSSCRYYTPGFERNMSDDMIRVLAENGGVIQINFGTYFINGEHQQKMSKAWDNIDRSDMTSEERTEYIKSYMMENDVPSGHLEEVADHIDHVVKLVGIDHVGIGSDYDGVSNLPEGLSDVSMYPNLIRILLERGYTEQDIQKIWSGNFLRVWKAAEEVADKLRNEA
jgi:membrane dipeptidase